jgi:hypothetical protein
LAVTWDNLNVGFAAVHFELRNATEVDQTYPLIDGCEGRDDHPHDRIT